LEVQQGDFFIHTVFIKEKLTVQYIIFVFEYIFCPLALIGYGLYLLSLNKRISLLESKENESTKESISE
jgi:hypothetical protein